MVADGGRIEKHTNFCMHVDKVSSPASLLKVKVKAMHISTENIIKTVTSMVSITNAIKYEVASELWISIIRFDLGQF